MMGLRRLALGVTVLLAVLGQAACMTMRPVELAGEAAVAPAIQAGDRIRIVDRGGTTTELVVATVGADFIEGTADGERPMRIAVADVAEIRERRVGVGKSIGLGVGVAFALFVHALSDAAFFP